MPYKCKSSLESDLLRVEVSGEWAPGQEKMNAIEVWSRVAKECRETGKTRILSIWDVSGHLPTMSAYNIANNPASFGWERGFKLALVHLQEDRYKDSLFAETVALNRGYNVKVFRDELSARKWIDSNTTI